MLKGSQSVAEDGFRGRRPKDWGGPRLGFPGASRACAEVVIPHQKGRGRRRTETANDGPVWLSRVDSRRSI